MYKTSDASVKAYAALTQDGAALFTINKNPSCTPLAPIKGSVNVSQLTRTGARVSWEAVENAAGYEYKLGDGSWTSTGLNGSEANPYIDLSDLTGATSYTIYLRAIGSGSYCAEGPATSGEAFKTLSRITAATNDGSKGNAKVSLDGSDWKDYVDAADDTRIYLQANAETGNNFSFWSDPTSGSIDNKQSSVSQLNGWSGDMTVQANFAAASLPKLATPTGMSSVAGAATATISWNAVDNATGYEYKIGDGEWTATTKTSVNLGSLTPGTNYTWVVRATGDMLSYAKSDACASQAFTTDVKKPTSIEITTAPTITEYLEGESFATAGMVVKVTYNTSEVDAAFGGYSVTPSGALEVGTTAVTLSYTLNGVTVETTQAITVHKKYTLTFKNNGVVVETRNKKEGDAYGEFPAAGEACHVTSTTFMGWSAAEILIPSDEAPTYAKTTDVIGTKNVVLNAVWAKAAGSPISYVQATSVAVGDKVVITQIDSKSDGKTGKELVSISSTSTPYGEGADFTTTPVATMLFDVVEGYNNKGVSFKNGDNYLHWASGNSLTAESTHSANNSWTITEASSRALVQNNATTSRYLQWNNSSPRFACYESKTTDNGYPRIIFYKQTGGTTYSDYLTTCSSDVHLVTVAGGIVGGSVTAPAAAIKDNSVELEATPSAGYTFGSWNVTYVDGGSETQTIEVTDNTFTMPAFDVTVSATFNAKPMTGLTLSASELTAAVNDGTAALTVTAYEPADLIETQKTLNWSSSDETVATVDGGTITLKKAGTATITAAWTADTNVKATCALTVYQWNLRATDPYEVTTAPATTYTDVQHFDQSAVVIKANYVRSDNNSITKQEALASGAWSVKLGGSAIADGYAFAAADNGKTLALYVGEAEVWSSTIVVTEVPKDRFVVGIWDNVEALSAQAGTYTMPTLSNQTAGEAATCKDHNIFVGWVEETYKDEPDDAHIIAGGATGQTASDKTYYAVWAKQVTKTEWTVSKSSFADSEKGGATLNTYISYSTQKNDGTVSPALSGTNLRLYQATSGKTYGNSITITASNGATLSEVELETSGDSYKYVESTYTTSGLSSGNVSDGKITLTGMTGTNLTIINTSTSSSNRLDISKMTVKYNKSITTNEDYITDCIARHDVTFDANGGAGSYDALQKKYGVNFALPDGSALNRDHYTFVGWRDNNAGTGTLYTTTYLMPDEDVTLYAQWEEDHHAIVRFMDGENEVTGSPIKVYDGGTFNLLNAPEAPANKLFVAWSWNNTSYTAGQTNQHMSVPAADRMYTAVWMTKQAEPEASVDLSKGKWILVKNANQLKAGDFIVIAAANSAKALSTNQKTNNRGAVDVIKTNDTLSFTITANAANVVPLFLQQDAETGFYALYDRGYDSNEDKIVDASGYLYANGGTTSNLLRTQADITMQGLWSISVADKKATVVAQGNNANRTMRFNSGSDLFTCYGSESQQPIAIYKWYKTLSGDTDVTDIEWTDAVIVPNGTTLTIDEDADLDNLIVENGGKVTVTGGKTLAVNDVTIESEAGSSGQLVQGTGASVTVNGDIYMDVTFFKGAATLDATTANRWYMISAPFDVNLNGGFFLTDGTPMTFGQTDGANIFDLFEYDGNKRATTGVTGWKRAQGKMHAGVACLIGFNPGQATTIRLKAAGNTISNPTSIALTAYDGDDTNKNWNGVANPTLHYTSIDKDVQIYNNEDGDNGRKYIVYSASDYSFVVGTPFFVQSTGTIELSAASNSLYRAPKREADRYEYCVRIVRNGANDFADQMYVRASEDASSEYEQGHDMVTWNGTTATTAMLWSENYGKRLAIEEAPMVGNKAVYTLGLYAPAAGQYRIEAAEPAENADLYLTKDGAIIWNLSMGAYELELGKGTTEGYGLLLQAKSPSVATGVDEVQSDQVQSTKVIIDDHVYILRGEQLYDVTGKKVK